MQRSVEGSGVWSRAYYRPVVSLRVSLFCGHGNARLDFSDLVMYLDYFGKKQILWDRREVRESFDRETWRKTGDNIN
jgi:hypothetical protein